MRRSLGLPSRSGVTVRSARNRLEGVALGAVVLIVVVGSIGLSLAAFHVGAPSGAVSVPSHAQPDQAPATHSDLVVGPGQVFIIQPSLAGPTYYQGGNITVESGGTLIVRNVTLSFVEFVGNSGTAEQRLSHIYHFIDDGTTDFYNATLTTDVLVINEYAKLNLTVEATLSAWNTTFAFPGWINVVGAGAVLTLNDSKVVSNPGISGLIEPAVISGDTGYAATINVSGGATMNLFGSQLRDTYADDQMTNGVPRPAPLVEVQTEKLTGTGLDYSSFGTPSDSANLTLDWLYPSGGVQSGFLTVYYDDMNGPGTAGQSNNTEASVNVSYGGTVYVLPSILLLNASLGSIEVPFTPALLAAISEAGMLNYLNYTGDFGEPSEISVSFGIVGTGPAVTLNAVWFQMNSTALSYNMMVSGAGSKLSAVDSSLDLNWNLPPADNNPYSVSSPYPWDSNKLLLENGATAYLANISVPSSIPEVYSSSAILPDSTSQVYFYRWAQFDLTGHDGSLPVPGAHVYAFYAYNDNQASNATATALNDLATADPAMWGYVVYWDVLNGIPSYATSNLAGQAYVLLAASSLTSTTLPDGTFLGGYHFGITVPAVGASHWFNWSVSPYPSGVALGTARYNETDLGPPQEFSTYYGPTVRFVSFIVGAPNTLNLNDIYESSGVIQFNASGSATIELEATSTSGGSPIPIALSSASSGSFLLPWSSLQGVLSAGKSYTLTATATYNGMTATYNVPGTFSVPATPVTATSFLTQKILWFPLWMWLAIAAAIVVGVVGFLLIARRTAAGKLVECGECGNLIPEDATVCPKCGAEFESDLMRCSRCASTIPADSKVCPECAAQLLGKPGEGEADPERQGYADFTEKYRAEGKRELGDNYSEGAFWDWWKRQPSYTSFSQWKLQQGTGTPRAGMAAPPVGTQTVPQPRYAQMPAYGQPLPRGGGAGGAPMPSAAPPPAAVPQAPAAMAPAAPVAPLKACPSCGKEIPPEYLVCPFCGAVTQ